MESVTDNGGSAIPGPSRGRKSSSEPPPCSSSPATKISLISQNGIPVEPLSDIKLIRTDTTLDLSQ